MDLNFSDFKAVETTNKRPEGISWGGKKGQEFKFRFRKFLTKKGTENEKIDSWFHFSDELFDKYSLETNAGRQIVSPDGKTFIAIVDNEHGTFLKNSAKTVNQKGRKFKSSIIEDALHAEGVINKDLVGKSQKLDLVEVAKDVTVGSGAKAFVAKYVLQVVVDETANDVEEDDAEVSEDTTTATPSGDIQAEYSNELAAEAEDEDEF